MMNIQLHDRDTAPAGSKPVLAAVRDRNGFVPNLFRALGNSPSTLNGFAALLDANDGGTLSPAERQIVQLTASIENRGAYCVAGHSAFAARMGIPLETITAIRENRKLADKRYQALVEFTRAMVRSRGHVSKHEKATFWAAGFRPEHVLEVVACVALKTITNFVTTGFDLPLDREFEAHAWTAGDEAPAA